MPSLNVSRKLTELELFNATEAGISEVAHRFGHNYCIQMVEVVTATVEYGITNSAPDPATLFDYTHEHVLAITDFVANWLRADYYGAAQYGLLDRTRHLLYIAHHPLSA